MMSRRIAYHVVVWALIAGSVVGICLACMLRNRRRLRDTTANLVCGASGLVQAFYSNASPLFADRDFDCEKPNEVIEWLASELALSVRPCDLGDTDEDGRPELVDSWGNPLAFFPRQLYGREQVVCLRTGEIVRIRECLDGNGTPYWPDDVQLWSFGPNGRNDKGRGDDIPCWSFEIGREARTLQGEDKSPDVRQ